MPPLMKLWLDEVFAFGWAYGPGGNRLCGTHQRLVDARVLLLRVGNQNDDVRHGRVVGAELISRRAWVCPVQGAPTGPLP
jgi:putative NADPH-quinone reductase